MAELQDGTAQQVTVSAAGGARPVIQESSTACLPLMCTRQAEEIWRLYESQRVGQYDASDAREGSRSERFLLVSRLKAQVITTLALSLGGTRILSLH